MAPQVLEYPGTRPTATKEATVDKDILACSGHLVGVGEHEHGKESRSCFYCLEGWVFLGSLDHDGEEVVEAIRCRCCKGAGRTTR